MATLGNTAVSADCLGVVDGPERVEALGGQKTLQNRDTERERDRQTDRQTERQREIERGRQRERERERERERGRMITSAFHFFRNICKCRGFLTYRPSYQSES